MEGPDDIDPKEELMRTMPDTVHWLERNGFTSTLRDGFWHKEFNGVHFNVRWPLWHEEESPENGWMLSTSEHGVKPLYNLTSDNLKRLLVMHGVATE